MDELLERIVRLEERIRMLTEDMGEVKLAIKSLDQALNNEMSHMWGKVEQLDREIGELKSPRETFLKLIPPSIGAILGAILGYLLAAVG